MVFWVELTTVTECQLERKLKSARWVAAGHLVGPIRGEKEVEVKSHNFRKTHSIWIRLMSYKLSLPIQV